MSQNERLMAQGQLAELEAKATELRIEAEGLKDALRSGELYEFKPIEEIDSDRLSNQALRLAATVIAYRDILDRIMAIKKALGK